MLLISSSVQISISPSFMISSQLSFIATSIAMNDTTKTEHSLKNIFLTSLFHLIGVQRFFGEKYTNLDSLTTSQKNKCFIEKWLQ